MTEKTDIPDELLYADWPDFECLVFWLLFKQLESHEAYEYLICRNDLPEKVRSDLAKTYGMSRSRRGHQSTLDKGSDEQGQKDW